MILLAPLTLLAAPVPLAPAPQPDSYTVRHSAASSAALLAAAAPEWDTADTVTWGPPPYGTRFRALWSGAGLHLRFDADDDAPWHTMTRRDAPIWEEEAVEIFLDSEDDGRYIEVELSPANVVCDLRRAAPGAVAADPIPVPSGVMDRGFDVPGLETSAVRTAAGWTGTLFLPWAGLGRSGPPPPGAALPFNVFRIKRPGGPEAPAEGAIFAAWAATGSPSFHVPEAFRPMRFAAPPAPARLD